MMIRAFLFLLVSACLTIRASEPISAKYIGASASVTQPHVVADLIPESMLVAAGKPFDVILHLHSDPGWHTYWINPGDAGLATSIKWTLPEGFAAGPIQWPTPEKHKMGPLVTYGYEGDVYLITTITPPATFEGEAFRPLEIKARASWLVCQEECIPGKGDFSLKLSFWSGHGGLHAVQPDNTELFNAARMRLPVPNKRWDVKATYAPGPGLVPESLWTQFKNKADAAPGVLGHLYFFPEQSNVLSATQDNVTQPPVDQKVSDFQLILPLQQNGEKMPQVSGVLVSDQPLIGDARAVYIPAFATDAKDVSTVSNSVESSADDGHRPPLQAEAAAPLGTAAATSETETSRDAGTATEGTQAAAQPILIAVLGAAFIGGLILNLMPCVLPVLSLKVFSLMKHAGDNPHGAWKQGAAFTAGVVVSFWLLAGLLLFLRAAGNQLGWGFQMQSPGFVLALIFIFFLLGLNLFGVFELGTSLVGLDAKVTGRAHGLTSSFLNGALATLAATPCTAPFMGSALGFAAQQPAFVSLLIFTFLAMGMAAPYLLLTIFPGALKFVPKPGAWMEAFKQFMGFLLMATVIFLIYVFGSLIGEEWVPTLLGALLLLSIGAWIYGRWASPIRSLRVRLTAFVFIAMTLGSSLNWGKMIIQGADETKMMSAKEGYVDENWQPWSQDAVDRALAQGQPVFVDFTAAWCLSCKVNERVALDVDSVKQAFAAKNVVLFKADWTHADPAISEALRKYNRDGVPLYLLYSPKDPTKPQVLPEVLTPGIVLEALGKI